MLGKVTAGAAVLLTLALSLFCFTCDLVASPHPAIIDRESDLPAMVATVQAAHDSSKGGAVGWLAIGSLFAVGLTITAVRTPNQPIPGASYAANVAILTSDASPSVIPLPTAFAALLANYGGTGVPATNAQLKFNIAPIALGTAAGPFAISYDGAGNLDIAHPTGANTSATLYISCGIPTTNNQP